MARPSRKRTALLLYGILLVLPTVVLGGLHWHQLWLDYQHALSNLPADAAKAADRLVEQIRGPLQERLERAQDLGFDEFAPLRAELERGHGEAAPDWRPTVLAGRAPEVGILGWFSADLDQILNSEDRRDADPPPPYFIETGSEDGAGRARIRAVAESAVRHMVAIGFMERTTRLRGYRIATLPWQRIAAHLAQFDRNTAGPRPVPACLGEHWESLAGTGEQVVISEFFLEILDGPDGQPVAVATRRVLPEDKPQDLDALPECLRDMRRDFNLLQGMVLDLDWLLGTLPRESAEHLGPLEHYLPPGEAKPSGKDIVHRVNLLSALGFAGDASVFGGRAVLAVEVEQRALDRGFRAQTMRFLGVAAMLVLSLGTGLGLLLFSVNRELERAERTRNFVAAVTHELRTPLSTIALHIEMLMEGWAQSPERQQEYYLRIARETQRLSTLVERVLEKSRLSEAVSNPIDAGRERVGDLSAAVESVRPLLAAADARGGLDVEYDLAPDLPPVRINQESITSIVVNLVENARKYAPVRTGGEPILVRTGAEGHQVWLEVLDRGPGVPEGERQRVFEAFYRIGNETTRTSTGTGLGLHLVDLQARALGGRAWVEDRPGGGSIFKVQLPAHG